MCRGCAQKPKVTVRQPSTPSPAKPKPKQTPREKIMGTKRDPK